MVYEAKIDLEDVDEWNIFVYLVELYIMSDKFGDIDAANMVMDKIIDLVNERNEVPGIHSITLAFDNALDNSPLRSLLVDLYINCGSPEALDFDSQDYDPPIEFLKALARDFGRRTAACNYDKKIGEIFCRPIHDSKSRYHQRQETLPVRGKRASKENQ